MVYTRFKCDRYFTFAAKYWVQEQPQMLAICAAFTSFLWLNAAYTSEETERRHGWWVGYPYWRDPIARRNEDKYKRMIRDNDVDIMDPIWTGVNKSLLPPVQSE